MEKQTEQQNTQDQSLNSSTSFSAPSTTGHFVDNRSKSVAQHKLQATANNSPQVQKAAQLQQVADQQSSTAPIQKKKNKTGLPDNLKSGIESLSGLSMDDVKVHRNSSKPAQLKAHAYAEGSNIHLAAGQEKHLPHEAWHVAQQKQGRVKPTMQMKGNVAVNDDAKLEREADVMGKKALGQGQSSNTNLVQKKAWNGVAQRAVINKSSHYGTFSVDDSKYKFLPDKSKLPFELNFLPTGSANATKVGLVQVCKAQKNGNIQPIDPSEATKMTPNGSAIDQLSNNRNPLYATGATEPATDKDKLESYPTPDGTHAIKDPVKGWSSAKIADSPSVEGGANSMKSFETSAIALEGTDKGTYYGSVKWGWEKDGTGKLKKIPFDIVSKGVPSKNFMEAAEKWNTGTARGTQVVKNNNTNVEAVSSSAVLFKLQAGDEVIQKGTVGTSTASFVVIEVKTSSADASLIRKTGTIDVTHLKDKGDGKATVDLPIVKAKVPTEADISLYKAKDKAVEDKKLGVKTRMKVLKEEDGMAQIEIVDGADITKKGWVEKAKIKDE